MLPRRYFAYGSNLDEAQMRRRCPSSRVGPRGVLREYALAFGGFSRSWGGATATVVPRAGAHVPGVLYDVTAEDLQLLDGFEGHPHEYERVVTTVDVGEARTEAWVYILPLTGEPRAPARRYLEVIERSYTRWGFDVEMLRAAARGGGPL
ncbi:MAG: gamma-glutamylcyclotransferase family protein [Myxococcota bacterium]